MQADEKFKEFYKFIKTEFDNGESIFEILEKSQIKKWIKSHKGLNLEQSLLL